jgi:hypothetical protein
MMIKNCVIKIFFVVCILITLCNTAFSQSRKEKKAAMGDLDLSITAKNQAISLTGGFSAFILFT